MSEQKAATKAAFAFHPSLKSRNQISGIDSSARRARLRRSEITAFPLPTA
jgi:hypothetical protein